MKKNTDIIIDTIQKFLPQDESEWELVGLINKKNEIYPFGNDSKILGRLFEVMLKTYLTKAAAELEFSLGEPEKQTIYPDFFFIKPNGRRIAIDVKTTYRKFTTSGNVSKFGFTEGSFTSYMRNGTKNIDGKYSDYDSHYIIGIVYTREENPTNCIKNITELDTLVAAYHSPEVFVQEKYRIAGDKKGSGNTDNIGTIKANRTEVFQYGAGPFSFLGEDVFNLYWKNYPLYKDSAENRDSLYTSLPTFIDWIRKSDPQKADEYLIKYNNYINFLKQQGWN